MDNDVVIVERPLDGVALMRINRPQALNALNAEVGTLLARHVAELGDSPEVRCIVADI